jgi:hypothetical protein
MKRREVATRLGVSVRYLRELEDSGEIQFVGGKGDERFFTEAKVLPPSAGEVAGDVFSMLEQKKSKIEIVIALKVDPERVGELAQMYQQMRAERGDAGLPCVTCKKSPARFCGACLKEARG